MNGGKYSNPIKRLCENKKSTTDLSPLNGGISVVKMLFYATLELSAIEIYRQFPIFANIDFAVFCSGCKESTFR